MEQQNCLCLIFISQISYKGIQLVDLKSCLDSKLEEIMGNVLSFQLQKESQRIRLSWIYTMPVASYPSTSFHPHLSICQNHKLSSKVIELCLLHMEMNSFSITRAKLSLLHLPIIASILG